MDLQNDFKNVKIVDFLFLVPVGILSLYLEYRRQLTVDSQGFTPGPMLSLTPEFCLFQRFNYVYILLFSTFCYFTGMGHEGTPKEMEDIKSFILDCLGQGDS